MPVKISAFFFENTSKAYVCDIVQDFFCRPPELGLVHLRPELGGVERPEPERVVVREHAREVAVQPRRAAAASEAVLLLRGGRDPGDGGRGHAVGGAVKGPAWENEM